MASERDRIDELVNTIDGVIYERNAATGEWLYVSRQVGSLLGYSPEEFGKNAGFWRSCILPAHQQMAAETEGVSRTLEYEVRAKDGRKIWIRDSALLIAREESHIVRGVLLDITREREADEELARANRMLVQTSRQAGMAEVATGVLHNVGTVLPSVNVAGNLLQESVRTSALPGLGRLCGLLDEHQEDLAEFLTKDPRGRSVAGYLKQLNQTLEQEQSKVKTELATLTTGVQHLQEIVATQIAAPDHRD